MAKVKAKGAESVGQVAEAEIDKNENSVNASSQVQIVQVNIDMSDERILQFNSDRSVKLQWNAKEFRKLNREVVEQLVFDNAKSYVLAEQKFDVAKAASEQITGFETPKMDLQDWASYRLRTRVRRGWHTYWAAPGADFDMRMGCGYYRQIRKHAEDANGNDKEPDVEPGYENGEVLKILDGEGKVELIALECPEEYFGAIISDVAGRSQARFKSRKEDLEATLEEVVNRHVDKDHRVSVGGDGLVEEARR